jgi:hypothetical protein
MRVAVKETTVYNFEELPEEAQRHALEKYWDMNVDYDWWEFTYMDASDIGLEITGFNLGRGQECTGRLERTALDVANKILENHGPDSNTYKTATDYIHAYKDLALKEAFRDDADAEYFDTEDIDDEFLNSLLNDYWSILYDEYYYLTSDKVVRETLIANEYEFDETGEIY